MCLASGLATICTTSGACTSSEHHLTRDLNQVLETPAKMVPDWPKSSTQLNKMVIPFQFLLSRPKWYIKHSTISELTAIASISITVASLDISHKSRWYLRIDTVWISLSWEADSVVPWRAKDVYRKHIVRSKRWAKAKANKDAFIFQMTANVNQRLKDLEAAKSQTGSEEDNGPWRSTVQCFMWSRMDEMFRTTTVVRRLAGDIWRNQMSLPTATCPKLSQASLVPFNASNNAPLSPEQEMRLVAWQL